VHLRKPEPGGASISEPHVRLTKADIANGSIVSRDHPARARIGKVRKGSGGLHTACCRISQHIARDGARVTGFGRKRARPASRRAIVSNVGGRHVPTRCRSPMNANDSTGSHGGCCIRGPIALNTQRRTPSNSRRSAGPGRISGSLSACARNGVRKSSLGGKLLSASLSSNIGPASPARSWGSDHAAPIFPDDSLMDLAR
jgi:hypothetical protein